MSPSSLDRWLIIVSVFLTPWIAGQGAGTVQSAMGDLDEFGPAPTNWSVAGGIAGDLRYTDKLQILAGTGLWVNQPDTTGGDDLVTTWTHRDLVVDFTYLTPAGSSVVLLFQGRYELALPHDRAPGLWEQARAEFHAPTFDQGGRKISPARLIRLEINGVVVRENETWAEPDANRGYQDETKDGPLIIAGNHGPLVLRGFNFQRLQEAQVTLTNLHHAVYPDIFEDFDAYRHAQPAREGAIEEINETLADTTDAFAMVVTGQLEAPMAGWYVFGHKTDPISKMRLQIDGREPVSVGSEGDRWQIRLAQGKHPFRLDYLRPGTRGKPLITWNVTGPDMRTQPLSFSAAHPPNPVPVMPITMEAGRIHTHRCFIPYAGSKRLYVAAVGTPSGIHYAYDLEWQTLLTVWKGGYLDAGGIWHQRGGVQQVVPLGSAVELGAKPTLAVLESAKAAWPDPEKSAREAAGDDFVADDNGSGPPTALIGLPSALSSHGYTLEPNGQPTFQFTIHDIAVQDRWTVDETNRGLIRALTFAEPLDRDDLYLLLADERDITAQDGYFVLGDRHAYLEWPDAQPEAPAIVNEGTNQQLRVHLPRGTTTVTYRLIW